MRHNWMKVMLASPAILVIEALIPTGIAAMPPLSTAQPDPIPDVAAIAEDAATPESLDILEQINLYSQADLETGPLEQINSVGELSDVSPTDWAFQAVSALAERHQCLLGYGDGTYRGNRAMTRYEFAASLNACLIQIQERIEDLNALSPDEINSIRRLQEEFAAELATLRGRVDALEVRAAELEANQFSPTTKLSGEVLMAPIDAFGDRSETIGGGEDTELSFGYQMRLVFDSSLTGRDRLRARLQSINVARLDNTTGTLMSRLGFDGESDNETLLERLEYRFAVTDNLRVWLAGTGVSHDHLMTVTNPLFESSGSGALSRFARRNPAVFRQPGGAGVGVEYRFGEWATLYGAYLAENANTPTSKNGLFDGSYSATAQLTATPVENLEVSVTYSNSYFPGGEVNVSGGTGSGNARRPFTNDVATSSNNLGVQASFAFAPVTVSGWAGWSLAEAQVSDGDVNSGDSATLFNWALNVGVPDLVKEGSVLGFIIGQPPKVISNDVSGREDPDTSLHFEALFKYPITERINITPGFFVITNPDHNSDNNTVWVGTMRTQFTF
ncbi:iron uptake porin [Laspinema olomoucense]|uniref:iron uptake porin n=1 Tax=Laspinema olomoucense TaxID=3231600 RepID=UPI0021BB8BE2|nr:iron uptake porin [Laspinema sp. D3a]MCT7988443.1 iron uptake porin [Laspinema sp. D3a]